MLKKLLEYNLAVFKSSITTTKLFVLVIYGLMLFLLFYNLLEMVFSIITLQNSPELYRQFPWLTPQRIQFVTLVFANLFWLGQFIFTNIRQLQLEANKTLLTVGFPARRLSRYLTIAGFFHPINLIFNCVWFYFLYLQVSHLLFIPVILFLIILNYCIIFSLKFRFLNMVRSYHKWVLTFVIVGLIMLSNQISNVLNVTTFQRLDIYIPTINRLAGWLPGGLLIKGVGFSDRPLIHVFVLISSLVISCLLFYDHALNTRQALQAQASEKRKDHQSRLREKICTVFGSQAGKYLYYLISHPYNRIQALFFLFFPVVYVPLMVNRGNSSDAASIFLTLFFLMYAPMGFMIMCLGNIFGYENRELLLHIQFPLKLSEQIKQRYLAALFIPLSLFFIITIIELILLLTSPYLLTAMLGNLFILFSIITIFTWSSFSQYQKIPWVSFSFSQPVVSKSVVMVTGLLMILLSTFSYISFGEYEGYKQVILACGILILSILFFRRIKNIHQHFKTKIVPQLWTEL